MYTMYIDHNIFYVPTLMIIIYVHLLVRVSTYLLYEAVKNQ
jgi:hypothetical protein